MISILVSLFWNTLYICLQPAVSQLPGHGEQRQHRLVVPVAGPGTAGRCHRAHPGRQPTHTGRLPSTDHRTPRRRTQVRLGSQSRLRHHSEETELRHAAQLPRLYHHLPGTDLFTYLLTYLLTRLVQRWVTVSGLISRCGTFISVCNQPHRSTQPGHPFVGRRNEYQPTSGDALRLGSKGRYGSCVGGR